MQHRIADEKTAGYQSTAFSLRVFQTGGFCRIDVNHDVYSRSTDGLFSTGTFVLDFVFPMVCQTCLMPGDELSSP
jgi:hypothetical protein